MRRFLVRRLIACLGVLAVTGCASTDGHSSSATSVRNPSAVQRPEDKCFTVGPLDAVPADLSRLPYNLNPGDGHDQPEKEFYSQFMSYESITSDFCWLAKAVEKRKANPVPGQSNIAMIHITHGARSKTYVSCHAQNLGIDLRCDASRTGNSENCFVYGLLEGSSCR